MREKNWDLKTESHVEKSKELVAFLNEIEEVCKKHNFSLSHEDNHGAFIIEDFKEENISWLNDAYLNYSQS